MKNSMFFVAVAMFAAACQNGKDSKSSESSSSSVQIGVEMAEVDSMNLLESPARPQRGMITCVDNRFPFIQVAFVDNVATIIRDKSDTFLGSLDSCTLKLTQFKVDDASYELIGGYGLGIDLFQHKDANGVIVASKLVRSGILLGLASKSDCTEKGQDCSKYEANFVYSQINSVSKSISNDLRVNQLEMSMEAEAAAQCNVSAKWLENSSLGGSPNLEIKMSSCSTLGGLPVQYGLNIKTAATQSATVIDAAHAIINNGQVKGSFSGSSKTIVLSLEDVQALNPGSTIFDALQADFELAIRGAGAISVSVYTLD